MKREATIIVKIELCADTLDGIDAAALEALAYLNCDIAMYDKDVGAFGAKIIDKGFEHHDEDRLFNLVLETSGVSEKDFKKSAKWNASLARNMFAYFAKKYLEWPWSQISSVVGRDPSTVSTGVRDLIGLVGGSKCSVKAKNLKGTYQHQRDLRASRAIKDMECIQRKWSEAKR